MTRTNLADHGEYLVGGRMDGEDDNSAPGGPLPQVLHQEERVKDVHPLGRLQGRLALIDAWHVNFRFL